MLEDSEAFENVSSISNQSWETSVCVVVLFSLEKWLLLLQVCGVQTKM